MPAVPYFAQFESRELIPEFLSGKRDPADDPLWHLSGASDSHEYAKWCSHIRTPEVNPPKQGPSGARVRQK